MLHLGYSPLNNSKYLKYVKSYKLKKKIPEIYFNFSFIS